MSSMLAQDGALPVRSTLALNQEHILRCPLMARSIFLLAATMQRSGQGQAEGINAGLAVVAGVRPENETEAMLAAISMLDTPGATARCQPSRQRAASL
jgi:hypothetical protein